MRASLARWTPGRDATLAVALVAGLVAALGPAPTEALAEPRPPVVHPVVAAGVGDVVPLPDRRPARKRLDGRVDDWTGAAPLWAGRSLYSAGELVYSDHLFDAHGAATPASAAEAHALSNPAGEQVRRFEGLLRDGMGGAAGFSGHYGAAPLGDTADLVEVRMAAAADGLWMMAKTTAMRPGDGSAVLVLLDVRPGHREVTVPFSAGLRSSTADLAALLTEHGGRLVDLRTGRERSVATAADAGGDANVLEARLPLSLPATVGAVVATGTAAPRGFALQQLPGGAGTIANVAFRGDEPWRLWFDERQADALRSGTLDAFALPFDTARSRRGATERFVPGPGVHVRQYDAPAAVSHEYLAEGQSARLRGMTGRRQTYGVYLPPGYGSGGERPMTLYLHGSGNWMHFEPFVLPGLLRDAGDARGNAVVFPWARDPELSFYLGASHLDVMAAFDDALQTVEADRDRVYAVGYSMGGWGSWLLPALYPDRFAATLSIAGVLATAAAPTGACAVGESGPQCYAQPYGPDPGGSDLRQVFPNLRNVPVSISSGAADVNAPLTNPALAAEALDTLGYRYRWHVYPAAEHLGQGAYDEWAGQLRWLDRFRRDPRPARVTYVRALPLERQVASGTPAPAGTPSDAPGPELDGAYWVDGIDVAAGRAAARVDAVSLARPDAGAPTAVREAGTNDPLAGNTVPYLRAGVDWVPPPRQPLANALDVATSGARALRIDVPGAGARTDAPLRLDTRADTPVTLTLVGSWHHQPLVQGARVASWTPHALVLRLPVGTSAVTVRPGGDS